MLALSTPTTSTNVLPEPLSRPVAHWVAKPGLAPILVLALASCTLLLGLGWPQLWDRDEPRNAGCTAEMLARADWVVPIFNAELRTHKPILLYWLQMAAYQVTGANEWGARLPSALLMMGTIFCAMFLSSRLLTHRFLNGAQATKDSDVALQWYQWNSPAMWTGMVLATSMMVIVAGRAATPDSPLIFCSTLSITALVSALTCHRDDMYRRYGFFFVGYLALGLGVLAKGPVGFVLPITVVSAWFQWERITQDTRLQQLAHNISLLRQWRLWLPCVIARLHPKAVWDYLIGTKLLIGLPLVLGVALPWYIWVGIRTDGRWLREFFWEHNVQRAVQSMEGHQGGPWYYPLAMLVGLFPWSLWLAPFLVWFWKSAPLGNWLTPSRSSSEISERSESIKSLSRLSLIWVAVFIGAFSCANTKLPSYITPCYPGAALLIGLFFASLTQKHETATPFSIVSLWNVSSLRYAIAATLFASAIIGIGATSTLAIVASQEQMLSVIGQSAWGLALTVAALAAAYAWRQQRRESMPYWFAAGSLVCISGWMVGGANSASRYRLDLQTLRQIQTTHPDQRWLAVGILEPSWVFYTGKPIPQVLLTESSAWMEQVTQHWEREPGLGVITLETWANELTQYLDRDYSLQLQGYRVVRREVPYFLRHQPLCLLTLEPVETLAPVTAEKSPLHSTDFR